MKTMHDVWLFPEYRERLKAQKGQIKPMLVILLLAHKPFNTGHSKHTLTKICANVA